MVQHDFDDADEVGELRNARLLAGLLGMQPAHEAQGLFELGVKVPTRFMIHTLLIYRREKALRINLGFKEGCVPFLVWT